MSCYHPIPAYQQDNGSISLSKDSSGRFLEFGCGTCIGCRLSRASSWAVRCMHEASLYSCNSFVTLTYADEKLPRYGSLDYSHVQYFLKRLRKSYRGIDASPSGKFPIRFFMAGEYGSQSARPHYHMLLFNFWFRDCSGFGTDTYTSVDCERLWPHGQSLIGSVTAASAAYVARYSLKKVMGRQASESFYSWVDAKTGEVCETRPEFCVMSRRPGIGAWWLDKYLSDVLPRDYALVDGFKGKVPRYYMEAFRAKEWSHGLDSVTIEEVKEARYAKLKEMPLVERSDARRVVQEAVKIAEVHHHFGEREL